MHKLSQIFVGMLCLLATCFIDCRAASSTDDLGWIQLFNGKNLDGWSPKIKGYAFGENFGNTYRVEDGVIKVVYDQYNDKFNNRFGHLFYKTPFSNYLLRIEYRFVGKQLSDGPGWATRNSGVMIHCQDPKTIDKDQDFPVCIEVQFLGGLGSGQRSTANLCTPGTHVVYEGKLLTRHVTNSSSKTYNGDQWVTVEVEARGSKMIKHMVEGKTVLSYTEPQLDDTDKDAQKLLKNGAPKLVGGGYISLQSESHPIEFRKVELRELKD